MLTTDKLIAGIPAPEATVTDCKAAYYRIAAKYPNRVRHALGELFKYTQRRNYDTAGRFAKGKIEGMTETLTWLVGPTDVELVEDLGHRIFKLNREK